MLKANQKNLNVNTDLNGLLQNKTSQIYTIK